MVSESRVPTGKSKNIAMESHHSFDPREYADSQEDKINIFPDVEHIPTQKSFHPPAEMSTTKEAEREFTFDIWNHFTKMERFDIGEKKYDIICKYLRKYINIQVDKDIEYLNDILGANIQSKWESISSNNKFPGTSILTLPLYFVLMKKLIRKN